MTMQTTEITQFVEQETTVAEELVVQAQNLFIASAEDSDGAGEWLKEVKAKYNALEKKRTDIVKPINDSVKEINKLFKVPQGILGKVEGHIKSALLVWNKAEQARIAEEKAAEERLAESKRKRFETLAAKAEEAGNLDKVLEFEEKAEAVETNVVGDKVEHAAGTFVVKRWKAEIVDIDALIKAVADGHVSNEAIEPNHTFLNGLAKRLKGAITVPGVKFKEEQSISSRRD